MTKLSSAAAVLLCTLSSHAFIPQSRLLRTVALRLATPIGTTTEDKPLEDSPTKQMKLDTPAARQKYVNFAKPRLLELLADLSNDTVVDRAHLLMDGLATVHGVAPFATSGFLELCLSGQWKLEYSNSKRRGSALGPEGSPLQGAVVRLSGLSQNLAPQQPQAELSGEAEGTLAGAGLLTTELQWELSGSDCSPAAGTFCIHGGYQLNTKGDLELTHTEYALNPLSGALKEPEALCVMLSLATPAELFDPDGAVVKTRYLDADLRIVDASGPRFGGARAVFTRILPANAAE